MAKYIVYHGTGKGFRKFNLKKTTQGIFWFTDDINAIINKEVGAQSHGYIYKCELTINNPCGWEEYEKLMMMQIKSRGYDGIILPDGDSNTYVVWDNSQIKILDKEKKNMKINELQNTTPYFNNKVEMLLSEIEDITRLPQFEDYIFKFKGEFEPPLNRIFLIAINKKTAEEIIIGKMRKSSETYSTDGRRISNKSRIVYDFTWSRDSLPILFGHEKVRAGSPRISSGLDLSATSTYSKLSLIFFKNQLKAAFEKYNKNTITEDITLDIEKGDIIKTGKFLNKKTKVKKIGKDEHGMPTVNGKSITRIRIPKIDPSLKENEERFIEYSKGDVIRLSPDAEVTLSYKQGQPPQSFIENSLWIIDDIEVIDASIQIFNISTFEPEGDINAGSFCSYVCNFDVKEKVNVYRRNVKESFILKILREAFTYKKVKSSNIEIIGYDPDTKILQVKFLSGSVYEYSGVPKLVYSNFLKSKSKGKFFSKYIKGIYKWEKIDI